MFIAVKKAFSEGRFRGFIWLLAALAVIVPLSMGAIQAQATTGPAPFFESAATNNSGGYVYVTFNKAMKDPSADYAQFDVKVGTLSYGVTAAALESGDPTTIQLSTESFIPGGQTVTVDYTGTSVVAVDGGVLASFTAQPVTNNVPAPPAPILINAATDSTGAYVDLTFDNSMEDPSGDQTLFTVMLNGTTPDAVTATTLNYSEDTNIKLTLTTPVAYGNTVTVAYAGTSVETQGHGVLASFTAQAVTNNVPAPAPTVSVGTQSGTITAGTAGSATFEATTTSIEDNTPVAIAWTDLSGTAATTPTGLSAVGTDIATNASTVTVTADATAVAGTYYFTATSDGAPSDVVTVTVSAPLSITGMTMVGSNLPSSATTASGSGADWTFTVPQDTATTLSSANYTMTSVTVDMTGANPSITTYPVTFVGGQTYGALAYASGVWTLTPSQPQTFETTGTWNLTAAVQDAAGTTTDVSVTLTVVTDCTVTYDANDAGMVGVTGTVPTDPGSPYLSGATVAVLGNTGNLAHPGSVFGGWNTTGSFDSGGSITSFTITGNTTLYALWTALPPATTYTVTFNSNGGSTVTSETTNADGTVTKPADPTRSGYKFGGWYSDNDLTTRFAFKTTVITGDTTLYALWKASGGCGPTIIPGGGTFTSPQSVTIVPGTVSGVVYYTIDGNVPKTDPSPITYNGGFSVGVSETVYAQVYDATRDRWSPGTSADFVINLPPPAPTTYTVTFNSNGGSAITSETTNADGMVTRPADPTRSGYTFVGWCSDNDLTTPFVFTTVITGDTTLYANWTAVPQSSITATAGTPQSATVGTAFATDLQATVTYPDDELATGISVNLALGMQVTFTAPDSGASGVFANGTITDTEPIINGVATASTFTANSVAGSYNVTANISSGIDSKIELSPSFVIVVPITPASFVLTNIATTPAPTGGGGGGGAPTVSAPTVQTDAATSVTASSAALNGDIASDNSSNITDYGFLWGASANSLTNKLDVGASDISGAFTAALSSLTVGTTYYFEAYATNSEGTADGNVLSFTTTAATPPPVPAPIFSDVSASYWGYNAIGSLSTQGYVYGYPDGTFKPGNQITRAEFCAIMDKVLNLMPYTPQTSTFTDVNTGDWFDQAVETAVYAGIAKGYGDGTFHPNAPISRQEIACVLVQALGKSQLAEANAQAVTKFTDDHAIAWWSRGYVDVTLQQGIVSGYPDNTFKPGNETTRAESCAMVSNFLKVYSPAQ